MTTHTILCTDPDHLTRAALPGWQTDLGSLDLPDGVDPTAALAGYRCPACTDARLTGPVGDAALAEVQAAICADVDIETGRRIRQGFEYPAASGLIFSLSIEAQANWLGLAIKPQNLTYPYTVRTMDDASEYQITGQQDAQDLVDAAFYAKESAVSQGRSVKAAVKAALDAPSAHAAAASWLAGGPP